MTAPADFGTSVISSIIKKVATIPPLPAAVSQLCRLTSDLEIDVHKIDSVIMSDQALAGRLLRVANSAFYGLTQRVTTVNQAVVIIGFQGVKNLALSVSVVGFQSTESVLPIPRETFWRHALAVASAARLLAGPLQIRVPEEAFTAGLLHDIGQLLLMEQSVQTYGPLLATVFRTGRPIAAIELEAFGLHHGAIGGELCRHWRIPPVLARVVADHHQPPPAAEQPPRDDDRILLAVQIADTLANLAQVGSDGDLTVSPDFTAFLNLSGLPPEVVRQALVQLPAEVQKMEAFLEMKKGGAPTGDGAEVCVCIDDAATRELVSLILLGLRCPLISESALEHRRNRPACVVTDPPLPAEQAARLQGLGVNILDLCAWRARAQSAPGASLPSANRLREWLCPAVTERPR